MQVSEVRKCSIPIFRVHEPALPCSGCKEMVGTVWDAKSTAKHYGHGHIGSVE